LGSSRMPEKPFLAACSRVITWALVSSRTSAESSDSASCAVVTSTWKTMSIRGWCQDRATWHKPRRAAAGRSAIVGGFAAATPVLGSRAVSVPPPKRVKRALRSLFLQGLIRLLALLPLRAALLLGSAVGRLAWPLARETRRQMLASLAVAYPERTPAEREAIARASLVHLAWLAAEIVTLPRYDRRLEDYVRFAGDAEQVFREAIGHGRGLVCVTGHVGNWELMARRVARAGIPNSGIAKASHDARMNRYMERFRAEGGVGTLWRENPSTARAMIRVFKEGKALGLLIDQDTSVQGVFVPFFGRLAFTPRAAGDLAMRFRAPVVVAWCRRRGPGPDAGHEIRAVDVPYDAEAPDRELEARRVTAACTAQLEAAIREHPEEWVWMHERWKTQPPPGEGAKDNASSVPKSRGLSDV